MIYRRLDNNGDYSFGRGKQDFISGTAAVAQAIKTKFLLLSAEWWEDQADGTPLFQNILGVSGTPDNLEAVDILARDRIINTENVTEIVNFSSTYEKRKYAFECTVNTIFGAVTVEVAT